MRRIYLTSADFKYTPKSTRRSSFVTSNSLEFEVLDQIIGSGTTGTIHKISSDAKYCVKKGSIAGADDIENELKYTNRLHGPQSAVLFYFDCNGKKLEDKQLIIEKQNSESKAIYRLIKPFLAGKLLPEVWPDCSDQMALTYFYWIAESLAELHAKYIAHGDFHPGNILVMELEEKEMAPLSHEIKNPIVVIDFDRSYDLKSNSHSPCHATYTPEACAFWSPDRTLITDDAKKPLADVKQDIYSFGCMVKYPQGFEHFTSPCPLPNKNLILHSLLSYLFKKMRASDPAERPTLSMIREYLSALLSIGKVDIDYSTLSETELFTRLPVPYSMNRILASLGNRHSEAKSGALAEELREMKAMQRKREEEIVKEVDEAKAKIERDYKARLKLRRQNELDQKQQQQEKKAAEERTKEEAERHQCHEALEIGKIKELAKQGNTVAQWRMQNIGTHYKEALRGYLCHIRSCLLKIPWEVGFGGEPYPGGYLIPKNVRMIIRHLDNALKSKQAGPKEYEKTMDAIRVITYPIRMVDKEKRILGCFKRKTSTWDEYARLDEFIDNLQTKVFCNEKKMAAAPSLTQQP